MCSLYKDSYCVVESDSVGPVVTTLLYGQSWDIEFLSSEENKDS